jgi:hypothetical protein
MLGAALALGVASTASAQTVTEQDRADARCFLSALNFKVIQTDGKPVTASQAAVLDMMSAFYIGRLRSRQPASTPTAAVITPDMVRDVQARLPHVFGPCLEGWKQYNVDLGETAKILKIVEDAG